MYIQYSAVIDRLENEYQEKQAKLKALPSGWTIKDDVITDSDYSILRLVIDLTERVEQLEKIVKASKVQP